MTKYCPTNGVHPRRVNMITINISDTVEAAIKLPEKERRASKTPCS